MRLCPLRCEGQRSLVGDALRGEPFGLRLPTISKHLKVLERAALVSKSRREQFRPCRLEAPPLEEVAEGARLLHGAIPPNSCAVEPPRLISERSSSRRLDMPANQFMPVNNGERT